MDMQPPSFEPTKRFHTPKKPSFSPFKQKGTEKTKRPFSIPKTNVTVPIVTLVSGLLFGMSAANARGTDETSGDLVELVRHRHSVVESLDTQMSGMKARIAALIEDEVHGANKTAQNERDLAYQKVTGPGVTITLTDAPPGPIPENATPNDLVIHQQDIENVMNALWSGGAEAMAVQGSRITNRSIIRCIGNVIFIDGVSYSPPYVIQAIGDPDTLVTTVASDPAIENYQAYVAAYGLGWKMEVFQELTLPAAQTDPAVRYAQLLENNG